LAQHSFAGENNRSDVNLGTFQPFLFYQLGGGTYLRAAPIRADRYPHLTDKTRMAGMCRDSRHCDYFPLQSYVGVPMGLGIGQVIKHQKTVYNFFIEPQGSVADHGRAARR
jgi:hypothetical protein